MRESEAAKPRRMCDPTGPGSFHIRWLRIRDVAERGSYPG